MQKAGNGTGRCHVEGKPQRKEVRALRAPGSTRRLVPRFSDHMKGMINSNHANLSQTLEHCQPPSHRAIEG